MNEIISGKDVVIDVYKIDGYRPFICADDISIELDTELISVKTIGHGNWKQYRGQVHGWKVSASSLIPYDNPTDVTIWDIIDRQKNMTAVPIRIVFSDTSSTIVKVVLGDCFINTSALNAPADFAKGSFSATGTGELIIQDGLTPCDAVIATLTLDSQTSTAATFAYTGATLATRFDYYIETVPAGLIIFSDSVIAPTLPAGTFTASPILPNGTMKLTVTPICSNGESGTPITLNFTKT